MATTNYNNKPYPVHQDQWVWSPREKRSWHHDPVRWRPGPECVGVAPDSSPENKVEETAHSLTHAHTHTWISHGKKAHHSLLVAFKILYYIRSLFVPEENVPTVTPTHYVLATETKEIDSFYWRKRRTTNIRVCLISVARYCWLNEHHHHTHIHT